MKKRSNDGKNTTIRTLEGVRTIGADTIENLKKLALDVSGINDDIQDLIVIEECSELTKELIKNRRGKGDPAAIIEEACDVLATIVCLFSQLDAPDEEVIFRMCYKMRRAIERYVTSGER